MPVTTKTTTEAALARALRHPLRVEIWAILDNRTASPKELSEQLQQPLNSVAYHVRELLRFECIELVRTRPARGVQEHFYRAVRRPYFDNADWEKLPPSARQGISGSVIGMIGKEITRSMEAGVFDQRPDRHLSRTPLVLDEDGWQELNTMLNETLERALDIQAGALARISDSGDEGVSVRLAMGAFESAATADEDSAEIGSAA
jgi:Helix-turn-helix domain